MAPSFDTSKHIQFASTFSENKVDKYLLHFEKVAYIVLCGLRSHGLYCYIQTTLVGKAREVYSAF